MLDKEVGHSFHYVLANMTACTRKRNRPTENSTDQANAWHELILLMIMFWRTWSVLEKGKRPKPNISGHGLVSCARVPHCFCRSFPGPKNAIFQVHFAMFVQYSWYFQDVWCNKFTKSGTNFWMTSIFKDLWAFSRTFWQSCLNYWNMYSPGIEWIFEIPGFQDPWEPFVIACIHVYERNTYVFSTMSELTLPGTMEVPYMVRWWRHNSKNPRIVHWRSSRHWADIRADVAFFLDLASSSQSSKNRNTCWSVSRCWSLRSFTGVMLLKIFTSFSVFSRRVMVEDSCRPLSAETACWASWYRWKYRDSNNLKCILPLGKCKT